VSRPVRFVLVLACAVAVIGLGAAAWYRWSPRRVPAGQPPLADLSRTGLAPLRDAFNAASAETRVLLLASPT
jgi:hypothetical protein